MPSARRLTLGIAVVVGETLAFVACSGAGADKIFGPPGADSSSDGSVLDGQSDGRSDDARVDGPVVLPDGSSDGSISDATLDAPIDWPIDAPPDAPIDPPLLDGGAPNIAFVTSTTKAPGALGGFVGADAFCNERATAAGLTGNYVAWLSTMQEHAHSRVGNATGWVRTDGLPFTKVLTGQAEILYPLRLDEFGNKVPNDTLVVTGSNSYGDPEGSSCGGWTDTGAPAVNAGWAAGGTSVWASATTVSCATPARIYCVDVSHTSILQVTPTAGRKAFVSQGDYSPSSGIAGADTQCANEAAAATLAGSYKALLATTSASAASRFNLNAATWVRTDGIPLATTPTAFMAGDLLASLNLSAQKAVWSLQPVWFGATTTLSAGTPSTTCVNWSNSAANHDGLAGDTGRAGPSLFNASTRTCDYFVGHVICLQE